MAMANTRTTFGALLGTITVAANVVSNSLSTIDTSVGMAATAIDDAARRQQARSKLDALAYKDTIVTEKSMELELQKQQVKDWCAEVEGRTASFNETYNRLMEALA